MGLIKKAVNRISLMGTSSQSPQSGPSAPPAVAAPQLHYIEKSTPAFRHTSLALFAGAFATFALIYCVQPLMPLFAQGFGINAAQSSLILSVTTFMLAGGLLFTGALSDALGRKPMMVCALFLAALFTFASALMYDWRAVLVMRALVGLSLSGLTAVAMTYLLEEIHPAHRGYAMGLYIAGNALGGMSGRVIGGILADYISWHWVLTVMGALALLAAIMFWRYLPPSRHFQARPFSIRGLLQGFALHLRNRDMLLLYLTAFLLMGAMATLYNYVSFHLLAAPFSLSQTAIGLLSLAYLSGMYSSAKAGAMADRSGHARVLCGSILLMLLGVLVAMLPAVSAVLSGMLLFTFGFFAAHSVASSWMGRRALQARGQAASLYQFFYYTGASVAGTVGGSFWHWQNWLGVSGYLLLLVVLAFGVSLLLARRAAQ